MVVEFEGRAGNGKEVEVEVGMEAETEVLVEVEMEVEVLVEVLHQRLRNNISKPLKEKIPKI